MSEEKKIALIDCGSRKSPDIAATLQAIGKNCDTLTLSEVENINFSNYGGIIISGAPILLTEVDFTTYRPAIEKCIKSNLPLLGICFGHQCIGMYFGATIQRCEEDRDWQTLVTVHESELLNGLEQEFTMVEDHCEEISLPKDFILVASSKNCKNEMMQHRSKLIFGVQFHPEVSDSNGELLLANFCETIID